MVVFYRKGSGLTGVGGVFSMIQWLNEISRVLRHRTGSGIVESMTSTNQPSLVGRFYGLCELRLGCFHVLNVELC